jgi:hypothetical protein
LRLISSHLSSSSSVTPILSLSASRRVAWSRSSTSGAVAQIQATITFVYALFGSPASLAPGSRSWNSSGPITPWISHRSRSGLWRAIDDQKRAISSMISAP